MYLKQVTGKKTEQDFLDVPRKLYKNDISWVCPQDKDIKDQFNPDKNAFFSDGDARRWVLYSSDGKKIGRIAAFYSMEKAMVKNVPVGGCGFFECIDDRKAAHMLFDKAVDWLQSVGMKAMDGPINFGENDSLWGLLVEGFTHPGIGMPYNFPYYRSLFEDYGFRLYFRQYSYHLDLAKPFPERFWKIASWIGQKKDYEFRHFKWSEKEKFIKDTITIYSEAWSKFKDDYTPLKEETLMSSLEKAKPILDPEMIWFAYHKDKPIAFFIMFPDANQILKEFKGKMNLLYAFRFIYLKKRHRINRIRALVAGVVPQFQNSGVESGIFWHLNEKMKHKKWYREIELSWVGDFNPKMISLYEAVGAKKAKTHHTYRYMIDPEIPFERYMPGKVKDLKLKEKENPEDATH